MNLSNLTAITEKKKRRKGQGHGSGRVKTAGRGTKGQKARGKVPLRFEGGALPLIKRLPFLRGKSKNKVIFDKPEILNLSDLTKFPKNSVVDLKTLVSQKLLSEKNAKRYGVKILGDGSLTVSLTVKVPVSESAKKKIEKAGGTVEQ